MKFVIGLIHYNDLNGIKRTIESIKNHVDHIITVDGRFKLREGQDYSSDGSAQYLKTIPNVIQLKFVGYEHETRQQYIIEARKLKADALLMIDSDEWLEGDWIKFKDDIKSRLNGPANMLGLNFEHSPKQYSLVSRVYVRLHEVSYWKTHNIMLINRNVTRNASKIKLNGMTLKTDNSLRSKKWLDETEEYQSKLREYERPFKKQVS